MPEQIVAPTEAPAGRLATAALLVGLLAGAVLRVIVYARNDSLWGDEAMLAANVCRKSVGELAGPLDYNQGAPFGFLAVSRWLVEAFGGAECVLRLPALVAGLASLPLVALVARRLLSPRVAAGAMWLVALSPHAVSYCAEFKQYELDLAIAAGLTLLTLRCLAPGGRTLANGLAAATGGALAVWLSHPAVFVLGGAGLALLGSRDGRRRLGWLAPVAGCWAASFAACFVLILKPLAGNRYLAEYWAGAFWPLPPRSVGDVAWLAHHAVAPFDLPAGFATAGFCSAGLAAFAALLGAGHLSRSNRPALVLLLAPLGLALVASALGKYPFAGRFLFFGVPAMYVLVAAGLGDAVARLGGRAALGLGLILAAPLLCECRAQLRQSSHCEDLRPVLARLGRGAVPGERLLANAKALPALGYYLPRTPGLPQTATALAESPAGLARQLSGYPAGPVLVVLSHATPSEVSVVRALLAALSGLAPSEVAAPGVVAVRAVLPGATGVNPLTQAGFRLNGARSPVTLDAPAPAEPPE